MSNFIKISTTEYPKDNVFININYFWHYLHDKNTPPASDMLWVFDVIIPENETFTQTGFIFEAQTFSLSTEPVNNFTTLVNPRKLWKDKAPTYEEYHDPLYWSPEDVIKNYLNPEFVDTYLKGINDKYRNKEKFNYKKTFVSEKNNNHRLLVANILNPWE